jgi:solute:Na+ symporter, SSS family
MADAKGPEPGRAERHIGPGLEHGRRVSSPPVALRPADLAVIGVYLVLALAAGLWASRRAGRSSESYFLADRSLPGWLVGISIVATTFAADTPLAISGMVAGKGIAANWFWWSMGFAHVGLFLFWGRLWRRAAVVTDAEFAELRYGGAVGRELRTAKAAFFALLYNAIVLGWVIRAMQKIAAPFARWDALLPAGLYGRLHGWWDPSTPLGGLDEAITIFVLVGLATLYSTLGGLRGVVLTDLLQFVLALIGAIALAWFAVAQVGGLAELPDRVAQAVGAARADEVFAFAPGPGGLPWLSVQAFGVYLLVRWWAHPMGDGGGYIAQRLSAARSAEDARTAAGVFVVLHYIVRPWPWIVVGLVGLVLFPPGAETALFAEGASVAADREMAYPVIAGLVLPAGLLGLLLASLLAAFMSTIDTHLNWGVSYLAHDLWKRRLRPQASGREVVRVGRIASVVFALLAIAVTTQIGSIEKAWWVVASLGSGLGLPVLLRWVWWRTNGQAELAGALGSLVVTGGVLLLAPEDFPMEYALALSVAGGVVLALSAIALFGPSDEATLVAFYKRVRPPGLWGPIRELAGEGEGDDARRPALLIGAWALGSIGLVGAIFLPGYLLLGMWGKAALAAAASVLGWLAAWRLSCSRSSPRSPCT